MKTYKVLLSQITEGKTSPVKKKKKKKSGKGVLKTVERKPGVIGSFIAGAAAAAHRHIMGTAQKYGYQPITDYMRQGGSKKEIYVRKDD